MPNTQIAEFTATSHPICEFSQSSNNYYFPEQSLLLTSISGAYLSGYKVLAYEIDGEVFVKKSDAERVIRYCDRDNELYHEHENAYLRKEALTAETLRQKCKRVSKKLEKLQDELEATQGRSQEQKHQIEALECEIAGLNEFMRKYGKFNNSNQVKGE